MTAFVRLRSTSTTYEMLWNVWKLMPTGTMRSTYHGVRMASEHAREGARREVEIFEDAEKGEVHGDADRHEHAPTAAFRRFDRSRDEVVAERDGREDADETPGSSVRRNSSSRRRAETVARVLVARRRRRVRSSREKEFDCLKFERNADAYDVEKRCRKEPRSSPAEASRAISSADRLAQPVPVTRQKIAEVAAEPPRRRARKAS